MSDEQTPDKGPSTADCEVLTGEFFSLYSLSLSNDIPRFEVETLFVYTHAC